MKKKKSSTKNEAYQLKKLLLNDTLEVEDNDFGQMVSMDHRQKRRTKGKAYHRPKTEGQDAIFG